MSIALRLLLAMSTMTRGIALPDVRSCLRGGAPFRPGPCAPPARPRRAQPRVQANLLSKLFGGGEKAKEASQPAPDGKRAAREVFIMANNQATPEFPPYTVVKRGPKYDLRLYDVYPIVEMDYSRREEGYAFLGAYIDGENDSSTKFSYAQPVIMRYYPSGNKVMQMYLGSRFLADGSKLPPAAAAAALTELPKPANSSVRLSVAGGELVAVSRFEGYITPTNAESARAQLKAALQADGISLADDDAAGYFRCAQYGAVYQLGGRLNEMMLRVKA